MSKNPDPARSYLEKQLDESEQRISDLEDQLVVDIIGLGGGGVFSLPVGTCLDDRAERSITSVPEVDCSEPHDNEVFALIEHRDRRVPGVRRNERNRSHPDEISKKFSREVAASGLPRIRLHDLRHTAASTLLALGVPAKVVSERLGHANISITLDIYSHLAPGMDAEASQLLARAYGTGGA